MIAQFWITINKVSSNCEIFKEVFEKAAGVYTALFHLRIGSVIIRINPECLGETRQRIPVSLDMYRIQNGPPFPKLHVLTCGGGDFVSVLVIDDSLARK